MSESKKRKRGWSSPLLASTVSLSIAMVGVVLLPLQIFIFLGFFLLAWILSIIAMAKGSTWRGAILFIASFLLGIWMTVHFVLNPYAGEITATFQSWMDRSIRTVDEESVHQGVYGQFYKTKMYRLRPYRVSRAKEVGGMFSRVRSGHNRTFLIVEWTFRNNTKKPIHERNLPEIYLRGHNGAMHGRHASATSAHNGDGLLSSLNSDSVNPGISVGAKTVFEVPERNADRKGWTIVIDADERVEFVLPDTATFW